MDIIVGTAGHIDHGKTALVKALTGVDADRLPEEKRRGITIDIGFAELDLGDARIGFVDVPGHERFVKNMLAGASGIDLVLLVVAADAGVMPQTREHFEICRLLEIGGGAVVITKTDLVDEELLELVKLEAAELVENSFLDGAPIVAVSAKSGAGLAELKEILREAAFETPARKNEFVARLPIDRAFSVRGFGAVVTGTLMAGEIKETDELEILPMQKTVRVRGLQTHGKTAGAVHAGQRAAVNLGGIEHAEIARGMVLAERGALRPAQIFDAEIEVLKTAAKSLKSRQRVRVHLGTVEALARVQILNETHEIKPGAKDFAQLRLEMSIAAIPHERFIVRSYSPQITIAGGRILDNAAVKHRRKDAANVRNYLENLIKAAAADDQTEQLKLILETGAARGLTEKDLRARTGWRAAVSKKTIAEAVEKKAVVAAESFYLARSAFETLKARTVSEIESYHRAESLARGILQATLREKIFAEIAPEIFKTTLASLEQENKIKVEKETVRLTTHNLELSADERLLREKLRRIYRDAGLEAPKLEDALREAVGGTKSTPAHARKIFQLLLNSGEVVKISDEFYFLKTEIENLIARVRESAANSPDCLIDVPKFKTIAGISRKYAIPLLEYFDRERVTRRAGDKRLIL